VLTRHDVQQAGARLHSTDLPAGCGNTAESATGGSTGIPVRVRRSELDRLMWNAAAVREELWHREDPAGRMVMARRVSPRLITPEQSAMMRSPDGLTLPDWGMPAALLWRTGPLILMDHRLPLPQQVALLRRADPAYLYLNPATLRLLLAELRDSRTALPSLRAVWTVGEVVDPTLRELCQDVLGVRIVHNYSAAEVGYIALQCPDLPHFHVQSELVLVEVLDAAGRACGPGEVGRVVVTPLHNFAMPLLRYELGDEAEVGSACSCGRGLPVLTRIVGRTVDLLTLPSGEQRRTDFQHYRLSRIAAIREYQVVQRSLEQIEVLLVLGRPLTAAEEQEARAVFFEEFGGEFRIDLTVCDAIPRSEAGKLRPFISDLPAR
jgi:phenylacetate-CoA ligase